MTEKGRVGDVGSLETCRRERRKKLNRLEQEMDGYLFLLKPSLGISFLFPQAPFLVPLTPSSFISLPFPSPTPAGDSAPGPDGSSWRECDFPMRDQRKPPTCHLLAEGGKSSRCQLLEPSQQLLLWVLASLLLCSANFSRVLLYLWSSQKPLQVIWED